MNRAPNVDHLPRSFKGKWLHIDMVLCYCIDSKSLNHFYQAACAHAGERGTGYGVALLLNTFVWFVLRLIFFY